MSMSMERTASFGAELAEDFAAGADGECAAGVFELGVLAAAVDAEDEGLILDGAGDGEGLPVGFAGCGQLARWRRFRRPSEGRCGRVRESGGRSKWRDRRWQMRR